MITEEICEIVRIPYKTDLEALLSKINEAKEKSIAMGYSNLELWFHHDEGGMTDLSLHGSRIETEDEMDMRERIRVIMQKQKTTSKGLTREDLLK